MQIFLQIFCCGGKLSADGKSYVGPNLLGRLLMELRDNGALEYGMIDRILSKK